MNDEIIEPWPWRYRPGSWPPLIAPSCLTFLPSTMKIHYWNTRLWSGQEADKSLSVTLTLVVPTWVMRTTHPPIMVNMSTKLFKIPSLNDKVMEGTRNWTKSGHEIDLWSEMWPWTWRYRPCFGAWHIVSSWVTFLPGYLKIYQWMERTQI